MLKVEIGSSDTKNLKALNNKSSINQRSMVRQKNLKLGKSSHMDLGGRNENNFREDLSQDSPRGHR